jgi:hypothetical protein
VEKSSSVIKEANRLYWQTDTSVADIAEQLSVSRRALYELVQPESARMSCRACGGTAEFVNRSAKASGVGRCQECGAECTVEAETDDARDVQEVVPPYAAGWPRAVPLPRDPDDDLRVRALKIGGIALAGAALGAATAMLILRRR